MLASRRTIHEEGVMTGAPFLRAGERAPTIAAQDLDSGASIDLEHLVAGSGSTLFVYWVKTGCPTCRLALPFIDRIARVAPERVLIVMQDEPDVARDYCDGASATTSVVATEAAPFASADAYGLTNVPTWFEVRADTDGLTVSNSGISFVKDALEEQFVAVGGEGSLFDASERSRLPAMQPG
ncbi:MAG: thioredoxin family protein [Planctomycetes bacterium]|nr:thioredoxin family protein [Planctomycetota bacterium]